MKTNSVLIVGCGDLGVRVAALLPSDRWRVTGLRRDISALPAGIEGLAADYTVPGALDFIERLAPDYVLAIFNPTQRSVEGYQAGFAAAMRGLLAGLGEHRPRHILACSSTRVLAEQQGGWVDEDSPLAVDEPLAAALIDMEQALLASGHSASVVRFAGIYGASGGRLVNRVARGELCSAEPVRYSNRIHREDCAGFLAHLLRMADGGQTPRPVYIGVDNEPAPQYEVEQWLARELGVEAQAVVASQGNSRANKRCRNDLLRATGYRLRFPDYRSGYGAVLR